jgi:hypothetical protein
VDPKSCDVVAEKEICAFGRYRFFIPQPIFVQISAHFICICWGKKCNLLCKGKRNIADSDLFFEPLISPSITKVLTVKKGYQFLLVNTKPLSDLSYLRTAYLGGL